ncbi:BREX-3 system phosphatase PglZ [Thauera butanivorans]|uniref:BREX-3 system phosphatase PglZ n=1 Tax=Thauera butanivorans TaxID=86174 RepID=UPI0008393C3F|nr:BREX-3 system phosphatase PglZ [Thauera butanivorans]
MSAWVDRILKEFTADLSRLWIAADPDGVLLDEGLLAGLRERGFDLLPFEDSIAFRAEYEGRYRAAWDSGDDGPAKALILQLRSTNTGNLPWDYLKRARRVSLTLADLFPKLSYSVIRQIDPEHHDALYAAQARHATQTLGESATKDFVLTHIFKLSPHLIGRSEDIWRELLRLHYRDAALPSVLAEYVAQVLSDIPAFKALPLKELFASKMTLLRVVQDAWYRYLAERGITGTRTGEPLPAEFAGNAEIPFEHPDVRVIVDSMFLEGLLHPLSVSGALPAIPDWAKVGIVQDPLALRNLVEEGIKGLRQALPGLESSFRDWMSTARKLGELIARFHSLDSARAQALEPAMSELQVAADESLQQWVRKHYADLPSLPAAKAPVMVHHIPRYLSMRRSSGEDRIALLVFDGLAIDQWVQIREALAKRAPKMGFDEGACFAWAPTLTSVSRQAIFSGMRPREFPDSIETTSAEPAQWSRFWLDQGLRANEVIYRKGLQRNDHLEELTAALASPNVKVVGLVVDTVDDIVHGAVLGKRGVATQIASWVDTGFVERLLDLLLGKGFHVYLTADHGNVDAVGQGRPKQGVAAELRGERVRTYRNEALAAESAASTTNAYRLDVAGLPANFLALFAGGRTAFLLQGDQAVVHGGISVEELLVPFVSVSHVS